MGLKVAMVNPTIKSNIAVIRTGRCQARCLPGIGLWPPIGLAQLATAVRSVEEVDDVWIYDAEISGDFDTMIQSVTEYSPDVLFINCTTPTIYDDFELAREMKIKIPYVLIAFYGTHATALSEEIINKNKDIFVDCILIGEPEITAAEVCKSYARKGKAGLKQVDGLAFILYGEVYYTNPRIQLDDLDSLGFPARELLQNSKYRLAYNGMPFTIIQPSRGCPNRCSFCTSSIFTQKISFRSVSSVLDEIEEVVQKYSIRDFMFLSDTFTASKKWVEELCQGIISRKLKIRWMSNTRADSIDEVTAKIMKKAGCWIVSLGIESASNEILKNVNKEIKIEDVWKTVRILKKSKIKIIGYFMFGLPGETKESIQNTIKFSCKLPIDYAYFYTATPFPGTRFFEEAQKNGWLKSLDWSRYFHGESDVIEYENLSSEDISKAVRKAYKCFYIRPTKILNYIRDLRTPKMIPRYIRAGIDVIKKSLPSNVKKIYREG